jgi:glycerol-3-phosphate dehydrogenase
MKPEDVISTFAGLRPLLFAEGGSYALSREHEIVESPSGLITVAGGKLTTHRLMGRQLTDRAEKRLAEEFGVHQQHDCCTKEPLSGAQFGQVPMSGQDEQVSHHLRETYGSDAAWIVGCAEGNRALGERIVPGLPYLMAEVAYAVQHEMALTLADVLMRRTHVIYEVRDGGLVRAPVVADLMAERLGWNEAERGRQVAEYQREVALTQAWRGT